MKKLVIFSNESVFSGSANTGVGETVDSLANSLGKEYDTYVICPDGHGVLTKFPGNMRKRGKNVRTCRVFSVTYFLVEKEQWPSEGWQIVDEIKPDILHNFGTIDGYTLLSERPKRMIYSFDRGETIANVENVEMHLRAYDAVRVGSEEYARALLAQDNELSKALAALPDFSGAKNGIGTPAYAPEKGLLVTAKYSAKDLSGKEKCKEKICKIHGIPKDKVLFLMMCHLCKEKGAYAVIECLHTIRDHGGFTLLVGDVSEELKSQLVGLGREDGVLWLADRPSPLKAIPMFAAADYYLCPSEEEPGGLLPMQASRYGTIPIVSRVGALVDNFAEENAIVIEENGIGEAIEQAFALYANEEEKQRKQKACMLQDFSWNSRKTKYTNLYEG